MNHNKFWTFCFSFIPGFGQMYLGYLKRGLSIMCAFWGITAIASAFYFDVLLFCLPVIWAFAFFDTFSIARQTVEQRAANSDKYMLDLSSFGGQNWQHLLEKRHKLFGWGLVAVGVYSIYRSFVSPFLWELFDRLGMNSLMHALNRMPTLVVAALVIALGVYLLRGSAAEKRPEDDYIAFKGDEAHE